MNPKFFLPIIVCELCLMFFCGCEPLPKLAPLTFTVREARLVHGLVLQITNRSTTEHLECKIYTVSSDRKFRSKRTFTCVIKSGEMQEVGFLELKRELKPNGIVRVATKGYPTMEVVLGESATSEPKIYILVE